MLAKMVQELFIQALQGLVKEEEENGIHSDLQWKTRRDCNGSDSDGDSEDESDAYTEFSGDYVPYEGDAKPVKSLLVFAFHSLTYL
jgi:hypothetical protein